MTTYAVSVTREGRWWMVYVPEIDQLTQARRLSEVERAAREMIAVTLDVPMSKVGVVVKVERVGDIQDVSGRAEAIREERARAAELSRRASEESQQLASQLAHAQVPVRDIGELLDVSHQRAQQLVAKAAPAITRVHKAPAKTATTTRAVAGKPKATKTAAGTHARTRTKD